MSVVPKHVHRWQTLYGCLSLPAGADPDAVASVEVCRCAAWREVLFAPDDQEERSAWRPGPWPGAPSAPAVE